ncbi:MAG: transcriptional repressor [Firmicutes bacterium]|nr:transcriptional repressor [Bacillota bacterium]
MEKRNTIQKQLVLDAVYELGNHPTADDVYRYVVKTHPTIGRGTIYRNLNGLVEEKRIRRIEISNGSDCFDHNLDTHYHVQCVKCNRVHDVDMEDTPDLLGKIKHANGHQLISFDILFKGICSSCREKES